jgi:hypothetical protein
VATVTEFPSLSWLAPTPVEALAGLADVVRDVLTDLAAARCRKAAWFQASSAQLLATGL